MSSLGKYNPFTGFNYSQKAENSASAAAGSTRRSDSGPSAPEGLQEAFEELQDNVKSLAAAKEESDRRVQELQAQVQGNSPDNDSEIAALKAELDAARATSENLTQTLDSARRYVNEQDAKYAEVYRQGNEFVGSLQSEVDRLTTELDLSRQSLGRAEGDLGVASSVTRQYQEALNLQGQQLNAAQQQVQTLAATQARLAAEARSAADPGPSVPDPRPSAPAQRIYEAQIAAESAGSAPAVYFEEPMELLDEVQEPLLEAQQGLEEIEEAKTEEDADAGRKKMIKAVRDALKKSKATGKSTRVGKTSMSSRVKTSKQEIESKLETLATSLEDTPLEGFRTESYQLVLHEVVNVVAPVPQRFARRTNIDGKKQANKRQSVEDEPLTANEQKLVTFRDKFDRRDDDEEGFVQTDFKTREQVLKEKQEKAWASGAGITLD